MADLDDSELWNSEDGRDDDGFDEDVEMRPDDGPTLFTLELTREGEPGGFHVRNNPGQKQRVQVSSLSSGPRNRPAFHVRCEAKAIVHGTLDTMSEMPATLLVYEFSFFSYRSTRFKKADILSELRLKEKGPNGLTVKRVSPSRPTFMMQTTQKETRKASAEMGISGGGGISLNGGVGIEKSVEKETTQAAVIKGDNPSDDHGNKYAAQWSLTENASQKGGIATIFRACILLTRPDEKEFLCVPNISARPNAKAWLGAIASSRTPDDAIIFDPGYPVWNELEVDIDEQNLGAVDLEGLWDCTFHESFDGAVRHRVGEVGAQSF